MKKSFVLLSALVVTTTFIVNCQKAPDKRRVRPTAGGSGSPTDVVDKTKLPTKVCSAELLNNYKSFHKSQVLLNKTTITASSTEAEKESQRKLGVETLAKCDEVIDKLKLEDNQGCYMDNGVKDVSNALMVPSMQNICNKLGAKLKAEVELDSSYADAAKENEKAKEEAKKVQENFIGKDKTFKISEQVLDMMYEGNTNLGMFLTEGEVKSSKSSLETALAASKTVCTAIGEGIAKDQTLKETVLTFTSFENADKSNLDELAIEFKGKATMINLVLQSEGEITTAGNLLCLNLEVGKLSVNKLTEVFGKAITSAPVQVSTEVTGATSESTPAAASATATVSATAFTSQDLAAKQPAGSPQDQHLASGTAQMIADANKEVPQKAADQKAAADKAAADKKAKEEKAAADKLAEEKAEKEEVAKVSVVTTPVASSAASATVATKEQVEDAAGQLAMLKEKAERLEAEAVAAEADVKKLEEANAKAEDVDQAKAKARITRESANSAKADYDAANKTAVAAK